MNTTTAINSNTHTNELTGFTGIDSNSNSSNSNKMATTRTIKIRFQGASREVNLNTPVTLDTLQQAIAATFGSNLPARSGADEVPKGSDLSFTYKDPEGDEIVFDKDSELSLALRLCPSSLEITAVPKKEPPAKKPDHERKMYQLAARNLREYNGVPSMTPAKLITTLAFLRLNPCRLVKQGLAPKGLLARVPAEAKQTKGREVTSVEDKTEERNDGVVSAEPAASAPAPAEKNTPDPNTPSLLDADAVVDCGAAAQDCTAGPAAAKKHNVLHEAFLAGDIKLRPREVRPLLLALAVRPCRLVKLGYVDVKDLRAMLQAEKVSHGRDENGRGSGHGRRQRMARGGGPADPAELMRQRRGAAARGLRGGAAGAPGVRGGNKMCPPGKGTRVSLIATDGGKPCGRKMMMRGQLHPVARPPPPPPAHKGAGEGKDGMVFAAANSRRVCGGGRRGAAHGGPCAPSRPDSHHLHTRGVEHGEEGAGSRRDRPHGMVRTHRARSGRQQQRARSGRQQQQQQQHGH